MIENSDANYLDTLDLEIDHEVTDSMNEAAKWAKFISIAVFVFCGLMLLVLIAVSGQFMNGFSTSLKRYNGFLAGMNGSAFFAIFSVAILLFVAVYYFLFDFSKKVKSALLSENTEELNKGINSLKIYFIIYAALGVLGIVSSIVTLFSLF